jgi:molecular chaperone GrpE (heat shock protein)
MSARTFPDLAKWPFFTGNAILLGLAYVVYAQVRLPLSVGAGCLMVGCGLAGAVLSVIPYVLEYRAAVRMAESGSLVSTVAEIRSLEMIAAQIAAATARWQVVQEHSASTVGAAKEISQKMAAEAAAFSEFLQKANDAERINLRLEVEKLRRLENDWLQVLVRQLDHTFALYKAAERSGQAGLVEQMGLFQNSCRESARRVGLVPLVPTAGEPLDPHRHRLSDPDAQPPADARVGEVVATGFTYQGRLIRPAMVVPQSVATEDSATPAEEAAEEPQEETLL